VVKWALLVTLVTSPALAADYDYTDAKGFRHWNHSRGVMTRRHTPPPVHHVQVAQHARKHANPANEALFKEFLAGRHAAGAVSPPPLPEPPPTPKGTAPPPPEWAGTIEEAVKRWPNGE
jgi:hypothetical protein